MCMSEYIKDLAQTRLFSGIETGEIAGLLDCIKAKRIEYKKDEFIIEEGNLVYDFGIMLSGHGRAIKWDMNDKVIIISLLEPGSEIGIILAASLEHKSPVSVQAQGDASVLSMPFEGIFSRCQKTCPQHDRLLRNFIHIIAEKGLLLHERMDCLLKPTVREKIFTYLTRVAGEQRSRIISVPINRNALAEYLNVERSALSRELSRMKCEGLIDYHRNSFQLSGEFSG